MAPLRSPCCMYRWPSSVWTSAPLARSSAFVLGLSTPCSPPTHPAHAIASAATIPHRSSRIHHSLFEFLAELRLSAGTVDHLSLQLAAGGVDVVATRAAEHGQNACVEQLGLEIADFVRTRALEARARERIERNQVDLVGTREATHELDQLAGMLGLVVHAFHERVFEGDRGARRTVDVALAG